MSDSSLSDAPPSPVPDASLSDLRRILDSNFGPTARPDTVAGILSADFRRQVDQIPQRALDSLLVALKVQLNGTGNEHSLRTAIQAATINVAPSIGGLYFCTLYDEILFHKVTTYTPFKDTPLQQAYSDMYARGREVRALKKTGDYEPAQQLVKHREELADVWDADNAADGPKFEISIDELVETYSQQASTSQRAVDNDDGICQADAGLWIRSVKRGDTPLMTWFNGLVEFESLPEKHPGLDRDARDESVRAHYRTGLCQALGYTTTGYAMCGAWLGAVWIGTRFSRIVQVTSTTILLEVGPHKPFNWPEQVWGKTTTPLESVTAQGVPFSRFQDASNGEPAFELIPLAKFLGRRTTGPDQLAHDVVAHDGTLDREALQVWLDLFFTAALDVAQRNVNDHLPTTPPTRSHLEETMRHLAPGLALPFKLPRDLEILARAGNDVLSPYLSALKNPETLRPRSAAQKASTTTPKTTPMKRRRDDDSNPGSKRGSGPGAGSGSGSDAGAGGSGDDSGASSGTGAMGPPPVPSRRMEAAYFGSEVDGELSDCAEESPGSSESFGPAAADETGFDTCLALEAALCEMGIHIVPVTPSEMTASILQGVLLRCSKASATETDNAAPEPTQWSPSSAGAESTTTLVEPSSPSRPSKVRDVFETGVFCLTGRTS